jgi:hypothetical protein
VGGVDDKTRNSNFIVAVQALNYNSFDHQAHCHFNQNDLYNLIIH